MLYQGDYWKLQVIYADAWSKNKFLKHPLRIDADADISPLQEKTCLTKELLENENSVFGNAEDIAFAEIEKTVMWTHQIDKSRFYHFTKEHAATKTFLVKWMNGGRIKMH